MKVIRAVVNPCVRKCVSSLAPIISRYFHDLDAAAMQHYLLSSPVTLSGDFEIEVQCSATQFNAVIPYVGYSSTEVDFFRSTVSTAANTFQIRNTTSGQRTITSSQPLVNNSINTIVISRVSGVVGVDVNGGGSATTSSGFIGDFIVNLIGKKGTDTNTLTGIIPSLKIWTGGDRTTGTLAHHWEFNTDLTSPTIPDLAGSNNATGINVGPPDAELFALNTSTTPDQWENDDKTRIIPIAGTP